LTIAASYELQNKALFPSLTTRDLLLIYVSREKSQAGASAVHNWRLVRRTVSSTTYRRYVACR